MLFALSRGTRAATVRRTLATFSLDSPSFPDLRARRDAYVDKTSAIADLLVGDEGMHRQTRAFFARPRKFGKSLTLDTAAESLRRASCPRALRPGRAACPWTWTPCLAASPCTSACARTTPRCAACCSARTLW